MSEFKELLGQTLTSVEGLVKGSERVTFTTTDNDKYAMFHSQDCCESVTVEDVVGNPEDLIGHPILRAEEVTSQENPPENADSFTWTFYTLATVKGYVTIRWLGESNSYYSESVDFERAEK